MSLSHSISTGSTSSSNITLANRQSNEHEMNSSNILYNDHQNYQTIFSNDSRFFDTSLHLYKSYRKLGYISIDNKKSKKSKPPNSTHISKVQSNGYSNHGRSKSTGFRTNHEVNRHNDGILKVEVPRNNDPLTRQRSDNNSSKVKPLKQQQNEKINHGDSSFSHHHQQWPSNNHGKYDDGNSSDESDIIVTRL